MKRLAREDPQVLAKERDMKRQARENPDVLAKDRDMKRVAREDPEVRKNEESRETEKTTRSMHRRLKKKDCINNLLDRETGLELSFMTNCWKATKGKVQNSLNMKSV